MTTESKVCENHWFKLDSADGIPNRDMNVPFKSVRIDCIRQATEVVESATYGKTMHVCVPCARILYTEDAVHAAVERGEI